MKKEKAAAAAHKVMSFKDTTASTQRAIVIQALRSGAKTTIQLRDDFGIISPAPRVFELKLRGYGIVTTPVRAFTSDGVLHAGIARYVLVSEPQNANAEAPNEPMATTNCEVAL